MAEISIQGFKAQLHPHVEFLRGRWQEFCEMVEKNAEQLAYYQEKHIGPKERLIEKHKKYEQAISEGNKKTKTGQLQKIIEIFYFLRSRGR